ncbi:MAG: DUF4091 domain-containing protein [Bacteroidaceae bacterium]|nr:DUF4091 domain-containing protein [Bacteroidaceae bacterium]
MNISKQLFVFAVLAFMGCTTVTAKGKTTFAWSSTDIRFRPQDDIVPLSSPVLHAWRGERVNMQAAYISSDSTMIKVAMSDLKCGKNRISSANISRYYEEYIIVDNFQRKDSSVMADRLQPSEEAYPVNAGEVRPLWFSIQVPQDAVPGKYTGTITLDDKGKKHTLRYTLNVSRRVLPEPKDWKYHLDLWQNPYAVARFFKVPLWSDKHFELMRPIMERYAKAGGKVITTSITYHPWRGQTYDPFESMIVKTKHIDGSWSYDYTVFDKWVEFMMSCGITKQIACYTIVPWDYKFEYLDQATASTLYLKAQPGDKAYEEYMLPFLTDLAKHLKAKGWFSRATIAMDERPIKALEIAWDIVQRADKAFRIEGAVNYKPTTEGVVNKMYGISVGNNHFNLPAEVLKKRKEEGKLTSIYTCCSPEHPNTFTFTPPAEAAFLGWHITAMGLDGYLRWALNSWGVEPEKDSRYGTWPSGDAWLLYPTGSSIRWERLVEGIQASEKIRILRAEGNEDVNRRIDEILKPFTPVVFGSKMVAADEINKANSALRTIE